MRRILVQEQLQRSALLLIVTHHTAAPEHRDTRIFDAELQRGIGGKDAPHLADAETDAFIGFEIRAGAPDPRRVQVNGLGVLIVHVKIRVDERLIVGDRRQRAPRAAVQKGTYPRFVSHSPVTPPHLVERRALACGHRLPSPGRWFLFINSTRQQRAKTP